MSARVSYRRSIIVLVAAALVLGGCAQVQERVREIQARIKKLRGEKPAPPAPQPPVVAAPAPAPAAPAAPSAPAVVIAPIPAPPIETGLTVRASCSDKDDTGYVENIQFEASNGRVSLFEARVDVPRRGFCRFQLADFQQARASPHIELVSRNGSSCAVRAWEQNGRVTVSVTDCAEKCTRGAFDYIWPFELDAASGSCS